MPHMKKQDFIFTIGYSGGAPVVDSVSKKRYGKHTSDQLLAEGMYRNAFASLIHEGNQQEIEAFVGKFNQITGLQIGSVIQLQRLLGVFKVPDGLEKPVYM